MSLLAENISFEYKAGRPVLREVSAGFEPGRVTAIVGPNGSGKSTLLRVLLGVARPRPGRGRVALDGQAVAGLTPAQCAGRIAYVAQRSGAGMGLSVRQSVALGRFALEPDGAAVDAALEEMELRDRALEPFGSLSAGQQQRATLARVLVQLSGSRYQGTRVLLADEPFAAMDPRHVLQTLSVFRRLATEGTGGRPVAVVVVMHDLSAALRHTDDVVVLNAEGRVAAAGTAAVVLTPDLLRSVFGVGFVRIGNGRGHSALVAQE